MTVDIHQENGAGNIITLCQDLEIKFQDKMFIVPAGCQSDGASVPEFLWSSVSPRIDPRTLRGALAHDYLYRNYVPGWSREDADRLFYHLIREDGLSWWKSQKAYWGIRIFGKGAWQHEH